MLYLRVISFTASSRLLLVVFLYTCLYRQTFSSDNFENSENGRTIDRIVENISSALSVIEISSEPYSLSTTIHNVSSSQHHLRPSQSKYHPNLKNKRHRRSISTSPPLSEEDEERVPYGPIWTGSRESLTCNGCDYNEIMRRNRIESIKEDLLRKLKMVAPPNITAPRYFANFKNILQSRVSHADKQDDPEMQNDEPYPYESEDVEDYGEESDKSTAMRVFNFCHGTNHSSHNDHEYVCGFTFQSHIMRMEVVSASTGIYVERSINSTHRHRHHTDSLKPPRYPFAPTVYLSKIMGNGVFEIFAKKKVHFGTGYGAWLEIDTKEVVQSWLRSPASNYGMRVHLETHHRDTGSYRIISPYSLDKDSDADHKPFIDVALKDAPRPSRSKRSVTLDVCEEGNEDRECCRYPLIINFTEYRWEFIVHPKTYNAYYCSGACTTALRLTHPHSHLSQQSDNSLCCSPKLYAPLILIYTDNESRVLSENIPSMIAERCGCS